MEYASHTVGSKNPIKRWLHVQRFATSFRMLGIQSGHRFLDYGCGDGELSRQVSAAVPGSVIVAFDPAQDLYRQAEAKLKALPNVTVTNKFDVSWEPFHRVCCLETLEHLPPAELKTVFTNINSVLREDGYCLFTFPIEKGLSSLVKNCYRLLTRRDKYASFGRTVRCLFGLHVPREAQEQLSDCNYIYSHVGFDARAMIRCIEEYFTVEKVHVIPFGTVALGMGNGVAVIARKKAS
jgi:ubiquinone/menaquinone biosynthesis C-methylase UbiE